MKILGIETSCDETAAAVVENTHIISNIVASQAKLHAAFGGVVPEIASRHHIEWLPEVVEAALKEANLTLQEIDGIAATHTPGLLAALVVGLQYGKSLSLALGKPFIGVSHLEGHLNSAFLESSELKFPFLGLIVSGGHTHLYVAHAFGKYECIGRTRDDACGEAYDKIAKLLGLGYPGGPLIDQQAIQGNPKAFRFTKPKLGEGSLEFSFSGVKTACLLEIQKQKQPLSESFIADLSASFQEMATSVLIDRIQKAAEKYSLNHIVVAGGVAANKGLRKKLEVFAAEKNVRVFIPSLPLCTDNAAMIAYVGGEYLKRKITSPLSLNAVAYSNLGES